MANFFDGLVNIAKHPLDEAQFLFDVGRGKTSLKNAPGKHQEMMNDITVPLLGDNKISKNSDAVAGAIVGSVLAAPFVGGAFGGSGASGSGGFGGFGTEGAFSNYFKPSSISKPGLGAENVGWQGGAELDLGLGDGLDYKSMAKATGGKGFDMNKLAQVMKSIKPADNTPPVTQLRSGGGGGGRYDKSVFENPLLTREMQALYNQPLYQKLT